MLFELYKELSKAEILFGATIIIILIANGAFKGIIEYVKVKKKKKANEGNPHLNCEHFPKFQELMKNAIGLIEKIDHIKYVVIPSEQMNEVKIVFQDIIGILRDDFSNLLDSSVATDPQKVEAKKAYFNIISRALEVKVTEQVEGWMMKNHFTEKNDMEFTEYITAKINKIYEIKIREVKDHYLHNAMIVTREEVSNSVLLNCAKEINPKLTAMFFYARSVAERHGAIIKDLDEQLLGGLE